ncbi:MAG: hypothetical protein ABFQ62_05645 [Patescibacteria group bacterium]
MSENPNADLPSPAEDNDAHSAEKISDVETEKLIGQFVQDLWRRSVKRPFS